MRRSPMPSLASRALIVSVALIEIAVLATLALLPAAPANAQDATGQIAFVSGRDEPNPDTCRLSCNSEIYIMNADGTGQTRLTDNPAFDSQPDWSPDGTQIAFVSDRDEPNPDTCPRPCNSEIYVMNADGSGQTRLTDDADLIPRGLAWSPDGTKIAFMSGSSIYVMNADGSGQTNLTNTQSDSQPAWSPDGSRIAFVRYEGVGAGTIRPQINVMNADGSDQIRLTNLVPMIENFGPTWSPDGDRIAYVASLGLPAWEISVMNADGSGQTRLTEDANLVPESLDWSPDGSRFTYSSFRDGVADIYVINVDGTGETRLTNNPARDSSPVWSPLQVTEPTPTTEPAEPTDEPAASTAEPAEPTDEPAEPTAVPPPADGTGPPQSEFVRSVPGPGDISTDPGVIGTNIFFTLVVILVFGFTSALFNETVSSNRKDIEGGVGRVFAPFRSASNFVERQYGALAGGRVWVQRLAGPAVILLLTGLVYGYLSSDFELDSKTAVLVVSMVLAVGLATYIYAGGEALFTRRVLGLDAGVKLYAVAVAIAIGFVLFSRLVEFQPGFMFGFVASFTLLTPVALSRERSGQAALFPTIALLLVSLIAWLLLAPLREVENSNAWAGLPEGTAAALVVAGLEGVFFSMIPLSFMHGARIVQWNRMLWLLVFALTGFLFWHVLLNQQGEFLEAFEETKIRVIVGLLSAYFVATLAVWAYFRGRVYGWSLPALVQGQAASGDARENDGD